MPGAILPFSSEQERSIAIGPDALWHQGPNGIRWTPVEADARGIWWLSLDGDPILWHDSGERWKYLLPDGSVALVVREDTPA